MKIAILTAIFWIAVYFLLNRVINGKQKYTDVETNGYKLQAICKAVISSILEKTK